MKISELINQLEEMKTEYGDLRVTRYEPGGSGVRDYGGAKIKGIRAKRPREYKTYYADNNEFSIEKVCHV